MEQHPLYWSLPPSGEELIWVEKEDSATRQRSTRRLFTVSRESRVQKRTDLELRLEFIKAHFKSDKFNKPVEE